MTVEREGKTYGLVTPKHNWLAIQIYIDAFVTECLQMPSHGTDILHLIPDSEMDAFGMVTSETVKMSVREIQKAARSAGLPFSGKNITPLLTSLQMLGFLETEEDNGKRLYFKSPMIKEPSTKIDWINVLDSTVSLMKETWPEVADEYISRYCTDVEVQDPFTLEKTVLGNRVQESKPVVETKEADYESWLE